MWRNGDDLVALLVDDAGRVLGSTTFRRGPLTADMARLANVGVDSYLVGESLMRQQDVTAATRTLLARSETPRATGTG